MDGYGILHVSFGFGVRRAQHALPPEHRIAAERRDDFRELHELLIAGPWMPPAETAPEIEILMTMHTAEDGIRLTGACRLRADRSKLGTDWEIGRWPTLDAWREAMDALADGDT